MKDEGVFETISRRGWPTPGEATFGDILERRAQADPGHRFCVWSDGELTIGALNSSSNRLANALLERGATPGDTVALMLDHNADHLVALYALAKAGLLRTSINVSAKGDYLRLLLADARPAWIIAEAKYRDLLEANLEGAARVVFREDPAGAADCHFARMLKEGPDSRPSVTLRPDDPLVINYTSGTTGAPKKFARTDRVLQIGSVGCLLIGDMRPGDVWLFWEPLYHGAGSQTALAACMEKVTLALTPRFSASRFWDQARESGATKIHYIGGILPILLKQPPRADDREHRVEIAWGAGCPADVWDRFEDRFGVRVHEGYGLSEVANYVTINRGGPRGSVGQVLPWFSLRTIDEDGVDVPVGETGEVVVKGKRAEYTSISLNETSTTVGDHWIRTGDLGHLDRDGYLFFEGRKSDSLRRRGENIAAWEVERVVVQHPSIEECALVGVPSGLGAGDDDLKLFVRASDTGELDELSLLKWCETRMPYFQIPRYVALVEDFPKTPTHRIKKGELSRSITDCWDSQKSGYVPPR